MHQGQQSGGKIRELLIAASATPAFVVVRDRDHGKRKMGRESAEVCCTHAALHCVPDSSPVPLGTLSAPHTHSYCHTLPLILTLSNSHSMAHWHTLTHSHTHTHTQLHLHFCLFRCHWRCCVKPQRDQGDKGEQGPPAGVSRFLMHNCPL